LDALVRWLVPEASDPEDDVHVTNESSQRLVVILDPFYGARLRDLSPGSPVWVVMSPSNAPIVRDLWATGHRESHLAGLTGMDFEPETSAEDCLAYEFATIDLHHGSYSTQSSYTVIEVIGARLQDHLRELLAQYGFDEFSETSDGFVASRPGQAALATGR